MARTSEQASESVSSSSWRCNDDDDESYHVGQQTASWTFSSSIFKSYLAPARLVHSHTSKSHQSVARSFHQASHPPHYDVNVFAMKKDLPCFIIKVYNTTQQHQRAWDSREPTTTSTMKMQTNKTISCLTMLKFENERGLWNIGWNIVADGGARDGACVVSSLQHRLTFTWMDLFVCWFRLKFSMSKQ